MIGKEDALQGNAGMEDDNESFEEGKEERADWTSGQDAHLKLLVNTHGSHNWVAISGYMNTQFPAQHKTSKQCRERWCNKLDPTINHSPWTKQEEAMLVLSHMKFKNRWCDIVGNLKGRHNNMIKNRFYSIFRKVKNKVKNNDFSYTSKLELIEIYYMITVMEEHLSNPLPVDESKRKRGKDFMYSLVEDINVTQLLNYKTMLAARYPIQVPLGHLLHEIIYPLPAQPPGKPVQQIMMPLGESMDWEPPAKLAHSATPGSCPAARPPYLTLPQPKSFFSKEALTPDEKDFVKQQIFNSSKTETPSPGSFLQYSPMIPVQMSPLMMRPNVQGYYSSGAGGMGSNVHVVKGGFGDISQANSMVYRPYAQTMMYPANKSFFGPSQMAPMSPMQQMVPMPHQMQPRVMMPPRSSNY